MRGDLKAEGRTEVAAQAEGVKAKEIKKLVEGRMRIEERDGRGLDYRR